MYILHYENVDLHIGLMPCIILTLRYNKLRPALSISIYPVTCDGIAEVSNHIPAKHFDELTRFHSYICATTPPDVKW